MRPIPATSAASRLAEPGFEVVVRLRVSSERPAAARAVVSAVSGALEEYRAENAWALQVVRRGSAFDRDLRDHLFPRRGIRLSTEELAGLVHVPDPQALSLGGQDFAARPLPPPERRPGPRRVIGVSNYPGREEPAGIPVSDWRYHAHVLGATGTGKSTLLLNLAVQDLEGGRGFALFDPKGDLVQEIVGRVPGERMEDVVLIDPSDPEYTVGLNVLESAGELGGDRACDELITVFKRRYERYWGPRTDDILKAAILTVLKRPEPTLTGVVELITNPPKDRRISTASLRTSLRATP